MIKIKKMDNSVAYLNPLLIEQLVKTPDVMVILSNGKKIVIRNNVRDILDQILDFWKSAYHHEHKMRYLEKMTGESQ